MLPWKIDWGPHQKLFIEASKSGKRSFIVRKCADSVYMMRLWQATRNQWEKSGLSGLSSQYLLFLGHYRFFIVIIIFCIHMPGTVPCYPDQHIYCYVRILIFMCIYLYSINGIGNEWIVLKSSYLLYCTQRLII